VFVPRAVFGFDFYVMCNPEKHRRRRFADRVGGLDDLATAAGAVLLPSRRMVTG
jgi:hypothetical protein